MIAGTDAGHDAVVTGHKKIRHRVRVAAGTAKPHHVPALMVHRHRGTAENHRTLHGAAVEMLELVAFLVAQPTMPTEPGGRPVPAAEGPSSVDAPAAVSGNRQA